MKFLVVIVATLAVAAASVINRKIMDTTMMDQNEIYKNLLPFNEAIMQNNMLYNGDMDTKFVDDVAMPTRMMMNPMMYYTMVNDMKGTTWQNMNTDVNEQRTNIMMMKIFMRMINQRVMMQMLELYGMNQAQNEIILDRIMTTQGIFDKKFLMEIIQDTFLRNLMIKHQVFNDAVMEVLSGQVTISRIEDFVNRQVLKNYMVTFGFCDKDILKRMVFETVIENMMSTEKMDRMWLLQVIEDSMLSGFLVQKGIFNEDILMKCLFNIRTHMITGDDLLKQLINKHMLKMLLMQHGFLDITLLNRMIGNEILGLKGLLHILTFDQTPNMTYRDMMGVVFNKPKWMIDQMHTLPLDNNMLAVTTKKTKWLPFMLMNDDFITNRDRPSMHYNVWNMMPVMRQKLNQAFY